MISWVLVLYYVQLNEVLLAKSIINDMYNYFVTLQRNTLPHFKKNPF